MKLFRLIPVVLAMFGAALPVRAELIDGVKAVVSDQAITLSQVEEFTMPVMETLQRQYAGQPDVLRQKYDQTLRDSLEPNSPPPFMFFWTSASASASVHHRLGV